MNGTASSICCPELGKEESMKVKNVYKDRNVTLYRKGFSPESLSGEKVSLWNLSPSWPGRPKSKLDDRALSALMKETFRHSANLAHLVLWMPASELHRTPFDPLLMIGLWSPIATILSGSDPLHIGFVYSNTQSWVKWTTRLILDERGKRGSNSTKTIKFMLEELGNEQAGPIADLFAHRSAILPSWSRRLGLRYIGYTKSKKTHASMVATLAQVELPGIQLECLFG